MRRYDCFLLGVHFGIVRLNRLLSGIGSQLVGALEPPGAGITLLTPRIDSMVPNRKP